jgi:hypothetical protein
MPRPLTAISAAVLLVIYACLPCAAQAPEALAQAKALLENGDGRAAAEVLEVKLSAVSVEQRRAYLETLRRAYLRAASQADADGQTREAENYRDNLRILDRKLRPNRAPATRPVTASPEKNETDVRLGSPDLQQARAPVALPEKDEKVRLGSPDLQRAQAPASSPEKNQSEKRIAPEEKAETPAAKPESLLPPPIAEPEPVRPPADRAEPRAGSQAPADSDRLAKDLPHPPRDDQPKADESLRRTHLAESEAAVPSPAAPSAPRDADVAGAADPPPKSRMPSLASLPPPGAPAPPQVDPLVAADKAFNAKRYDEAGQLYASQAANKRLPNTRRDAWAYCRSCAVVERINAQPRTSEEWASIRAEIEQIRRLSPKNWFAEYLRNLAAERSGTSRRGTARKTVLRGASPDEPPRPATGPAAAAPQPPSSPSGRTTDTPPRVGQPGTPVNNWRVWETPNFRILHADDALAERVARVAEITRDEQVRHWHGASVSGAWSPRCDIYLYPSTALFRQMTGQAEDSPGFSTIGLNAGRVVARRLNLRATEPKLLAAILPHEVTHVVLADLFTTQQIPRWADEGMAVLSEPRTEQDLRAQDLAEPLSSGRLFRIQDLMAMDYPEGRFWALYYAQSVSLTRFLVSRGSPSQFVQFVKDSQRNGIEAELKRAYQIEGFADLQTRWLAHARGNASAVASSTRENTGATAETATR